MFWYINRLRTMSFFEVIYRIFQFARKIKEKMTDIDIKGTGTLLKETGEILSVSRNNFQFPETFEVFGHQLSYGSKINWHRDMYTTKEFPRIFSKDLRIQSDKFGSAKHVWEINRLIFLPWICFNYANSGNLDYLQQFKEIVSDWIRENPYLLGINWYSNIEVNIRLVNWFLCWEILHADNLRKTIPEFDEFVYKEWLPVIYLHCMYSYANPSKFSSANNHLISEFSGLFIASSKWKFRESGKWNRYAKIGLEAEIWKQHSKNGINKEEAAGYIQFITDFLLLAYIVGEKTENTFSESYKSMLQRIFKYINCFTDIDGNFPKYGDADDGRVFQLDPQSEHNNFRSLLTSGTILFKDPILKTKSLGIDLKNHVLFGNEGESIYHSVGIPNFNHQSCFYPDEGHFILRQQKDNQETFIHFDAAQLGYLSIAAHGHADALSFILHLDGKEVLVDPGTFVYHTDPEWRQYFIGTLAHNTIRINRSNQAINGGPTMWLNHYKIKLLAWNTNEETDRIIACHDGYKRFGVMHTREFLYNKSENRIVILDHIECRRRGNFFIEFPIHLHPDMIPKEVERRIHVHDGNHKCHLEISVASGFRTKILKGSNTPLVGWYSRSFCKMEPAFVIYQTATISSSTNFKTTIQILPNEIAQ